MDEDVMTGIVLVAIVLGLILTIVL